MILQPVIANRGGRTSGILTTLTSAYARQQRYRCGEPRERPVAQPDPRDAGEDQNPHAIVIVLAPAFRATPMTSSLLQAVRPKS